MRERTPLYDAYDKAIEARWKGRCSMTNIVHGTPQPRDPQPQPRVPQAQPRDPLPPAARIKLTQLAGQAADARDAAASAQRRLEDLRRALNPDAQSADAAGIEHEMSRLTAVRSEQNRRQSERATLVASLNQWLQTLPPGAVLEWVKPPAAVPLNGEALPAAIGRVRDRIAAAQQHLRAVQIAPLPKGDLKVQAATTVQQLAARGRPAISLGRGRLAVKWRTREATSSGASPEDVAATLAWLDPAAMTARLEQEIDLLPEAPLAMPAQEREQRIGELTADLDRLAREEEALVEAAIAAGIDVLRRPDASPAAVLGVAIKGRAVAA